jgi:ubiquinone/menaquinone biosynthesis C-methylase UbiE
MNQDYINLVAKTNQGNPSPGGLALLRQTLSGLPPLRDGAKILEIGINTGSSFIALSEMFPEASLTGIDIDEAMIEAARSNYASASDVLTLSSAVTIEKADATKLPYANESYDLVVSGGTLSFVGDRAAAVAEIHRVLKPAGFFVSLEYAHRGGNQDEANRVSEILGFDVTQTSLEYWSEIHSSGGFSFEGVNVLEPFVHRAFSEGQKLDILRADNVRLGTALDEADANSIGKALEAFRIREASASLVQFTLRKTIGTRLLSDVAN